MSDGSYLVLAHLLNVYCFSLTTRHFYFILFNMRLLMHLRHLLTDATSQQCYLNLKTGSKSCSFLLRDLEKPQRTVFELPLSSSSKPWPWNKQVWQRWRWGHLTLPQGTVPHSLPVQQHPSHGRRAPASLGSQPPDTQQHWTPTRSKHLGALVLMHFCSVPIELLLSHLESRLSLKNQPVFHLLACSRCFPIPSANVDFCGNGPSGSVSHQQIIPLDPLFVTRTEEDPPPLTSASPCWDSSSHLWMRTSQVELKANVLVHYSPNKMTFIT